MPTLPATPVRRSVVVGGVAALVLVAGGAGVAIAHAQESSSSAPTTAATGSATTSPTASATGKAGKAGKAATGAKGAGAGAAEAGVAKQILGNLKDFQHAEWVTGSGSSAVTHEAVQGSVTAVSATSITVTAADGTALTFAVGSSTTVHGAGKATKADTTIADVKTGATVLVGGAKSPDLTASAVVVRAAS